MEISIFDESHLDHCAFDPDLRHDHFHECVNEDRIKREPEHTERANARSWRLTLGTQKMKTAITLALLLAAVLHGVAGETNVNFEARCAALSNEEQGAFRSTKFWGRKAFVSHPGLSSNEVATIKGIFLIGKTTPDEAFTWFRQQDMAVATNSYQGCVRGNQYTSFMRKIDADSWLVFFFGGSSNGSAQFLRGERLHSVYLLRKEGERRGIEDIFPIEARYNESLFKDEHPHYELPMDVDVKVETDL